MAQNFELGNRIDRWLENKSSVNRAHIVGAVDQEIIRFRTLTIDGIGLILSRRTAGFEQSRSQGYHSRLKKSQLGEVTPIERKVENLTLHHGLAETADCALHQRSIRAHFDLLRLRPQLEVNADRRRFVHIQRDSLLQVPPESFRLNL